MGQRNSSLTVALCVSLIAHGLGLSGLAWWYIQHYRHPKTEPIDRYQVMVDRMFQQEKQSPPPPRPATPPPPAAPKPSPPPVREKYEKPKEKLKDDSGEADGTGTANRSTPGAKPMQAEDGPEQADLMKPANHFTDAFLPASAGKPLGNNADQQKSPRQGTYAPDNLASANATKDPAPKTVAISTPVTGQGPPVPETKPVKSADAPASGTKTPVSNVPLAQAPTPKPLQREVLGHHATVSDTESVALSANHGFVFRAGHMEARKGLTVKTKLPIYGDASYHDAEIVGDVPTLFGAKVDADGNVLDVEVLQTSGSRNIDQDRKLALWMWTLMPQKDKDGHLVDDTWIIAFE